MTSGHSELRDRLRIDPLRGAHDPRAPRERVNAFYASAFLPLSYTDDEFGDGPPTVGATPSTPTRFSEYGGFDLAEWLDVDPAVNAAPVEGSPQRLLRRPATPPTRGSGTRTGSPPGKTA